MFEEFILINIIRKANQLLLQELIHIQQVVGVYNLDKVGLEAGAAHEASVDVRAGGQFAAVGCGHAAPVHDAQVLRYLGRDVVPQPLPERGVDRLGLLGGGGLARSDGPHWLVRQYQAGPGWMI